MISGYALGDLTRNVTHENNRNLIDTVANTWDTTLISQFDYTNDDAGKRTSRADSGSAFASTQQNTFGYNARNEVTSATMRNGNSIYNFDQIGNRVLADVPAATSSPGGTFNYLTNALNQYTSIASTPSTPSTPTHDPDGNLTDDGDGTTFEWNAENRMVRVSTPTKVIENTYDGQGRRVRKQVFTSDLSTLTSDLYFFYDGWNLIYEIDVLTATEPTYYVWGLDLSQSLQGAGGVGGLLMVHNDETSWAPTYDANGNISEYINLANGAIDAHLEYDAFGRIIASTGTAPSNFGFSTKYEDVETGYLYYGFRYYDPETGRWPNRDPIRELGFKVVFDLKSRSDFLKAKRFLFSDLVRIANKISNGFNNETSLANSIILLAARISSISYERFVSSEGILYGFLNNNALNIIDYLGLEGFKDDGEDFDGDGEKDIKPGGMGDIGKALLEWVENNYPGEIEALKKAGKDWVKENKKEACCYIAGGVTAAAIAQKTLTGEITLPKIEVPITENILISVEGSYKCKDDKKYGVMFEFKYKF